MWSEIKENYRLPVPFMTALPWVIAVPFVVESLQHIIEWQIGMFDSLAGAEATESHWARMAAGYVKVASLLFVAFFVWRFHAFGGDRSRALSVNGAALIAFAPVIIYQILTILAQWQVGSLLSAAIQDQRTLVLAGGAVLILAMGLELLLAPWKVEAAVGRRRMTIMSSIRAMQGNVLWSFGFTMLMFFPATAIHYLLNGLAIGSSPGFAFAMLAADSVLLAYLAALLPTTVFIIARRAGVISDGAAANGVAAHEPHHP